MQNQYVLNVFYCLHQCFVWFLYTSKKCKCNLYIFWHHYWRYTEFYIRSTKGVSLEFQGTSLRNNTYSLTEENSPSSTYYNLLKNAYMENSLFEYVSIGPTGYFHKKMKGKDWSKVAYCRFLLCQHWARREDRAIYTSRKVRILKFKIFIMAHGWCIISCPDGTMFQNLTH